MDSMMNAMGFKRVVDYGEPTHWWCPKVGHEIDEGLCPYCIPVYAVIPEGERPQTTWGETGGDDAVCLVDDDGDPEFIIGFEAHRPASRVSGRRCAYQYDDEWVRWGALSSADKRDDPNDFVGAIRHVAEE